MLKNNLKCFDKWGYEYNHLILFTWWCMITFRNSVVAYETPEGCSCYQNTTHLSLNAWKLMIRPRWMNITLLLLTLLNLRVFLLLFSGFCCYCLVLFYIRIVPSNSQNYTTGLNWFLIWEKGKCQYFVSQLLGYGLSYRGILFLLPPWDNAPCCYMEQKAPGTFELEKFLLLSCTLLKQVHEVLHM